MRSKIINAIHKQTLNVHRGMDHPAKNLWVLQVSVTWRREALALSKCDARNVEMMLMTEIGAGAGQNEMLVFYSLLVCSA